MVVYVQPMIRQWIYPILALAAVSCAVEQSETVANTPCDYTVQEHNSPQLATYSHDLNIPYKQEKLVEFMWVDLEQSECYAKQFAPVKIYRVPYTEDSGSFDKLPEAPSKAMNNWKSFEVSSGNTLKGLTTFRFESGQQEKIVDSQILVRADASPWHLWHEFSHFVIGTERAGHHDQTLQIAEQYQLSDLQNELLKPMSNESKYSEQLQTFFNTNHEYITKRFIDEMVIESTLVFLTTQHGAGTPRVSPQEIQNSVNMILYFSMQMSAHTSINLSNIAKIRAQQPLTEAQKALINMAEKRIMNQKLAVDSMIHDVTRRSSNIIFSF